MTKGLHKKKSKRVPAKRRYNIEKKVREHNRKLKKEIRKKGGRKHKAKDPGIPNSLPFKEQVIKEAQEDKRREEERKQLIRNENTDKRKNQRSEQMAKHRKLDLVDLQTDAEARNEEFESKNKLVDNSTSGSTDGNASNLKAYYKEFHKVIEASDVVIQVLDSRDPIGSRCRQVEDEVMKNGANKRLILLLNKVDLIPRDNLAKWLKYLRNEWPTVAFKACTQKQNKNLSSSKVNVLLSSDQLLESSKCLGADILMKLLSNYCRNKDIKTSITVGIVGFPNVGKSSVINSLKRCHACNVGSTPGLTKAMQTVSLDKRIKLLDSPGIIFSDSTQLSSMALRNAVRIDSLPDPITPIEALLQRVNRQDIQLFYRLSNFKNVSEFLALLAKRFGKLKKGGVLDVESAARKVLNDWNVGKIKYFTLPPETQSLDCHINAEIVSQMSEEFDMSSYADEEAMELSKLPDVKEDEAMAAISSALADDQLQSKGDHESQPMEDDNSELNSAVTNIVVKQSKIKSNQDLETKDLTDLKGMQMNKEKKLLFKKLKKNRKRKEKVANKLSDAMETNVDLTESYDFDKDFN